MLWAASLFTPVVFRRLAHFVVRLKIMLSHQTAAYRDEVVKQLHDDILSYGWLRQIAETQFGIPTNASSQREILDVFVSLIDSGSVVIGEARNEDGMVLIHSWSERGESLMTRIETVLEEASEEDRNWVFWLQLRSDYEKNEDKPNNKGYKRALQRTRRGRRGCNRCVPWAGSLSLGRWVKEFTL